MKEEKFLQELARDHTRVLIGYAEQEEGFYPIYKTPPGYITTRGFIFCRYCNYPISSSGGPKHNAVCEECYENPDRRT